jgi:hypothetical protein
MRDQVVLASIAEELVEIFPEDELSLVESIPAPYLQTHSRKEPSSIHKSQTDSSDSYSEEGQNDDGQDIQRIAGEIVNSSANEMSSSDQDVGQIGSTTENNGLSSTLNTTSELDTSSGQLGNSSGARDSSISSADSKADQSAAGDAK